MKKVSIVIPVYNQSKYLNNFFRSIKTQTYQNLEIIFINDGSTDDSLKKIILFAENDKRVQLYDKENGGVSSARNIGIDKATGTYVLFLDSDDFFSDELISKLVKNIEYYEADVSMCNMEYVNGLEDLGKIENSNPNITVMGQIEVFNKMLDRNGYLGYVWNKLFRLDIIKENNILFNEKFHMFEDQLFSTQVFKHSSKFIYDNTKLYSYVLHDQGYSNNITSRKLTGIEAYNEIINEVETIDGINIKDFKTVFSEILISFIVQSIPEHNKEIPGLKERLKSISNNDITSNIVKISRIITLLSPQIMKILMKLRSKTTDRGAR